MPAWRAPVLPARDERGHKGTFGTVAVVGGCAHEADADGVHMLGGPAFCAGAALRAGCGLARLVTPAPVLDAALAVEPSATGIALPVDAKGRIVGHEAAAVLDTVMIGAECVAIGPGLGASEGATALVLRCAVQEARPVVFDADALNALASVKEFHLDFRAPAVLTPHPGEYRRLASALGIVGEEDDPAAAASALARRLGCVVVLKGAQTAVSDGHETRVHDRPNPVLGTAGTGDVLAGILASLIAQHAPGGALSLLECASGAVEAHARAAWAWADETACTGGMTAADLLGRVAPAVESLRAR